MPLRLMRNRRPMPRRRWWGKVTRVENGPACLGVCAGPVSTHTMRAPCPPGWMTDSYRAEVLGRHYNERRLTPSVSGAMKGKGVPNSGTPSGSAATAKAIAKKAKVGQATVRNYAAYASAVEKMKAVNPEAVQRIRNGEIRDAKRPCEAEACRPEHRPEHRAAIDPAIRPSRRFVSFVSSPFGG